MQANPSFQHVATFYSLIVGLAVANVLSVLALAAKTRARVRWYWVHTAAAAMVLLLVAQDWWFLLSWDRSTEVSHAILLFLLARAGVLYFVSNLLVPESHDAEDGLLDLRVHMLRVRRRFFAALAVFPILDLADTLLKGRERLEALGPYYPGYVALFFVTMAVASLVRGERVGAAAIVLMNIVLVWAVIGGAVGLIR